MTAFLTLVLRDIRLATRVGGGGGMAVFFFLIVLSIVPLGVGPDLNLLTRIAPGMLWVALLLSVLLTLDRLFQADQEDGTLDLLSLGPVSLELQVLAKALSHWLTTGLPLILAAPMLGFMLNLPISSMWPLVLSMAVGSPALSLLGAAGAALAVGVRRGGLLISLLVLPLYVPVLIFGVSATRNAVISAPGDLGDRSLMLLGAVTLISLVVGPIGGAAALRANFK
ncbi:MAG: heme exporter protein CcmB [Alphaproteobacteria bacterium]|jgi:heme exporter protein B|nr:heme exporter protein CcmB [Alphaproteobacteria bacterium]MBO6627110.1 heme exporter protein CcmB [Alphaproteobacteria bacterium]MDF1626398.1 heme exporter protein CcmB [Parvibaculaceae bacterium]